MPGYYFSLNWVDVLIAVALITAASIGFIQGLLRLLFAVAATYVSFILASQYFHVVGHWFSGFFSDASDIALDAVGFALVFIVAQVGVNSLGFSAYKSTRMSRIGVLDQLAGSFIGLSLGFMMVSIALIVLNYAVRAPWIGFEGAKLAITETTAGSVLIPMFLAAIPPLAETVRPWLPTGLPTIFYL